MRCGVRLVVDLNDRMAHHAFAPVLGTHSTIASHTPGTDASRDGWLVSHFYKGNLSKAPIITICHSPESIEMTNEDQKPCWQAQRAECWTELSGSSGVDLMLEQVSITAFLLGLLLNSGGPYDSIHLVISLVLMIWNNSGSKQSSCVFL